jgi:hypothetical protein
VKRPKDPAGQLANELLAAEMLRACPPAWRAFYDLVADAVTAKARAEYSKMPGDRSRAKALWEDLRYALDTLAREDGDAGGDLARLTAWIAGGKGGGR